MAERQGFLRELRPHAAWRGIELLWDVVRVALVAAVVAAWQWFTHHWDLITIILVFAVSLGLLIWRDVSRNGNEQDNGGVNKAPTAADHVKQGQRIADTPANRAAREFVSKSSALQKFAVKLVYDQSRLTDLSGELRNCGVPAPRADSITNYVANSSLVKKDFAGALEPNSIVAPAVEVMLADVPSQEIVKSIVSEITEGVTSSLKAEHANDVERTKAVHLKELAEAEDRYRTMTEATRHENVVLKARARPQDSRPPLARLSVKYDRLLNHKTGPGDSYEVLWIQNTQLSVPFTAEYVSARVKFTRQGGTDSCTITESLWIYEHTDAATGFIGSSVPSWVNIEGGEAQALVVAVRQIGGTLLLREPRGGTAHFFKQDTSWDAAISIISDNTEPLLLKTNLIIFPNGDFQWAPVSVVEVL